MSLQILTNWLSQVFNNILFFGLPFGRTIDPRVKELRHQILTLAHHFFMVLNLTFQSNLVPKLTFGAEVHSLVPKLLVPNIDCP